MSSELASLSSVTLELDKVAPFLIKLFEIVSSPASDYLICWSDLGDSFRIIDRTKFAQDVLPLYFKHDNLRSFIRQLNIYGFQRVPNQSGRDRTMEFQHPMFTRNGVRNLKDIKRGNQPKKAESDEGADALLDDGSAEGGSSGHVSKKARQDYSAFKTDVARLQQNLDAFEADLKEHTMQVQLKLAYILSALDDSAEPSESSLSEMGMAAPQSSSSPSSDIMGMPVQQQPVAAMH